MLYSAAVFLILAVIFAVLGFGGLGVWPEVFRVAFFVCIPAFVTCLLMGVFRRSI